MLPARRHWSAPPTTERVLPTGRGAGSGGVGIGVTDPAPGTLDVNGTIRARTGGVKFPDGTTQSTAAATVALAGSGSANSAAHSDHNHTGTYAGSTHNHDASYAAMAHLHETAYSAIAHSHDAAYVNEGQSGSITAGMLANGVVANDQVAAGAAIAPEKIAGTAWTTKPKPEQPAGATGWGVFLTSLFLQNLNNAYLFLLIKLTSKIFYKYDILN